MLKKTNLNFFPNTVSCGHGVKTLTDLGSVCQVC